MTAAFSYPTNPGRPAAPNGSTEGAQRRSDLRGPQNRPPSFFRRFVTFVGWLVIVGVLLGAVAVAFVETRLQRAGPIPAARSDIVLIVGSDTREGLPDDLEGRFGDFAGERADVVILANPQGAEVRLLSLPRDLKVTIPAHGTDKINAAYAYGGLDLLAQTITANLGIPIGHALRVDFGGFASIVDSVGGVELDFPLPTRDQKSGLLVETPGVQEVDGATALAYARSRSTEVLEGGEWRSVGSNDIERTARQREVLAGIADAAKSPEMLLRAPFVAIATSDALAVDDGTHSWDLALFTIRLALATERISESLPVVGSSEGGVSYVVADGSQATQALEAFAAG